MFELVLALAASGVDSVLLQLLPVCFRAYPRRAVLLTPVCHIIQGGEASAGSQWRSATDRLEVSGMVPGRGKSTKEMYDKSETASKPIRFELGKSEKNRRNLKLIQTCDFLFFCAFCI